jgi:predicted nucleic acid-binding protein
VIVVDSSAIVAALNAADAHHTAVRDWLAGGERDLVTTPLVVAEVDHVLGVHGAQEAFREELASGTYLVEWWPDATAASIAVAEMQGLGLTDASLVVLAERVRTTDIATFDEHHFRALRPTWGGDAFRLLPLDQ